MWVSSKSLEAQLWLNLCEIFGVSACVCPQRSTVILEDNHVQYLNSFRSLRVFELCKKMWILWWVVIYCCNLKTRSIEYGSITTWWDSLIIFPWRGEALKVIFHFYKGYFHFHHKGFCTNSYRLLSSYIIHNCNVKKIPFQKRISLTPKYTVDVPLCAPSGKHEIHNRL